MGKLLIRPTMKRTIRRMAFLSLAVAAAACAKDEAGEVRRTAAPVRYIVRAAAPAAEAADAATRTSLDGRSVLWSGDDRLALFNEDGAAAEYTLATGAGTGSATFAGDTKFDRFPVYAVYPYAAGTASGRLFAVTMPAEQRFTADGFACGAFPMAAVSADGETFAFRYAAALLKLELTGGVRVRSVALRSKGGAKLAGDALIDLTDGTNPVLTVGEGGVSELRLVCDQPVTLSAVATPFYFVLPAGPIAGGLEITVTDTDGRIVRVQTSSSQTLNLLPGKIKSFSSPLDVSDPKPERLYIYGSSTVAGYDPARALPMECVRTGVYAWSGLFYGTDAAATKQFKLLTSQTGHVPSYNRSADGGQSGRLVLRTELSEPDLQFVTTAAGWYAVTADINAMTLAVERLPVYFVGGFTGWSFVPMTPDTTVPGAYTLDYFFGDRGGDDPYTFKFASHAGWDSCYHPLSADAPYTETEVTLDDTGDNKWKMDDAAQIGKWYRMTLDTRGTAMTLAMKPLDFYLVGDAAAGWDAPGCFADPDYRLGSTDEGARTAVWSGRLNAGELKFCGADRTVDWTHGTWYLAAAGGETIVSGRSYPVVSETLSGSDVASDHKWIVPEAGDYTVVFDWEHSLLTVTKR